MPSPGITVGVKAVGPTAVASRLKAFLSEQACRASAEQYGRSLHAVVLTGSLARDEATFVRQEPWWTMLGDADFLLVLDARSPLPGPSALQRLAKRVEEALAEQGLLCHLSLGAVHPNYFRRLRPHIFAFELRACGQVLWGNPGILSLIPEFLASDIPLEDGWRLLSNRMVEFLGLADELTATTVSPHVQYRTAKLYLDMATSLLLFAGNYQPTYRGRLERLAALAAEPSRGEEYPFPLSGFARRVAECTGWKLRGVARPAASRADYWAEAVMYARRLWRWELQRLLATRANAPDRELLARWIRRQPWRQRLRGWLYVWRRQGWRNGWQVSASWLRAVARASPRYAVYGAASELFFRLPLLLGPFGERWEGDVDWARVRHSLPVFTATPQDGIPAWRRLAADVVWNYHRFLEGTRA